MNTSYLSGRTERKSKVFIGVIRLSYPANGRFWLVMGAGRASTEVSFEVRLP